MTFVYRMIRFTSIILLLVFIWFGCEKNTEPLNTIKLDLHVEFVSVTEAVLKLNIDNIDPSKTITVSRDSQIIFQSTSISSILTIYDKDLFPGKEYSYVASVHMGNQIHSSVIQLMTLDTTRSSLIWNVYTLGVINRSSLLNDVAIVNENDIWVVGHLKKEDSYTYDSLGNWIEPYNAAHWNGDMWNYHRIPAMTSTGILTNGNQEIYAVFSFSSDDIWTFSEAGSFSHWNGESWSSEYFRERSGRMTGIWGSSPNDLFFIGDNGSIAHFNGENWSRIQVSSEYDITDIYGTLSIEGGEKFNLSIARGIEASTDWKLIKINSDGTTSSELSPTFKMVPHSLWYKHYPELYICGSDLLKRNYVGDWQIIEQLSDIWTSCIRGNDINDIMVVGNYGFIAHFNGISWSEHYIENIRFKSLDYNANLAVAVGQKDARGKVVMIDISK